MSALPPNWRDAFRGYQLEDAQWLTDLPEFARARCLTNGLGTGKALALTTPIPTPGGWRTMASLESGDTVFDETGKPCRVTATHLVPHPNGVFDVYFADGEVIRACGDHLWLTYGNGARKALRRSRSARDGVTYGTKECVTKPRIHTTRALMSTVRGTNGREHAIPCCGELQLAGRNLPIDPYTLGVWLGDGHSRGDAVTLHAGDAEIVAALGLTDLRVSKGNARTWRLSTELREGLKAAGLINNKHVPDDYFWSTAQHRLALLQGLMDTDGTIEASGACTFDNTNANLADAVQVLCASLGIKTARSLRFPKITGHPEAVCRPCHRVFFTTTVPVFRFSAHKRARLPTQVRPTQMWRYIDRIVPVLSAEPMKCITVDSPNKLYLCGRTMVPTHNTSSALASTMLAFERNLIEQPLVVGFTTASSVHDWRREAEKRWPGLRFVMPGVKKSVTKRKSETAEEFEKRKQEAHDNAEWLQLLRDAASGKLSKPALLMGDYYWAEQILGHVLELDILLDKGLFDEAHLLKKASSGRARSVKSVIARTRNTTLLTGTPVHNRAHDLHNLLRLIAPSRFPESAFTWARDYFHIRLKDGNYPYIADLKDKPRLIEDIKPYVAGRTAAELMGEDLPARTFQLKLVDVPGTVRMSPAKMRAKKSEEVDALLRETVKHKFEAALEVVRDADKPAVLYTYRREDAAKLHAFLNRNEVPALLATGDLTNTARDKVIERWKLGEATALVCTMDAVRESATLTRADLMVFVDLHWLPTVLLQCQGRIDPARQPADQRRPVLYVYLVTKGGPDEVVAEVVVEKLREASGVGVKTDSADRLADFLAPLDSRKEVQKALDPQEVMASLVDRLNARANRLADLGML